MVRTARKTVQKEERQRKTRSEVALPSPLPKRGRPRKTASEVALSSPLPKRGRPRKTASEVVLPSTSGEAVVVAGPPVRIGEIDSTDSTPSVAGKKFKIPRKQLPSTSGEAVVVAGPPVRIDEIDSTDSTPSVAEKKFKILRKQLPCKCAKTDPSLRIQQYRSSRFQSVGRVKLIAAGYTFNVELATWSKRTRAEMGIPMHAYINEWVPKDSASLEMILCDVGTVDYLLVSFSNEDPNAVGMLYHSLECLNKVAKVRSEDGHGRHYLLPFTKHEYLPYALACHPLDFCLREGQLGFIWVVAP